MIKTIEVPIPARPNAPATKLFVKIVAQDEASLKTKPYLFMFPGGPGFNHTFYQDYSCLQAQANVVFHDPRGWGLSEKGNPSTYTMDNYIQDVDIIRQHLKRPFINIVGKSYGAVCALAYAIRYPAHVEKLVLAAGATSHHFLETAKENLAKRALNDEQRLLCQKLWDGTFESNEELARYNEIMGPIYSYKKRHGEQVNRPKPTLLPDCEPINKGFGDFLRTFNFESQLQKVNAETLILVGEEDWITDKKYSEIMSRDIPNNTLVIFPKADHSMESDVPELYFNTINQFMTKPKKNFVNSFFRQEKGVKSRLDPSLSIANSFKT